MSLQDFRITYPEYDGVPDDVLVSALYKKFGEAETLETFADKIGYQVPVEPVPEPTLLEQRRKDPGVMPEVIRIGKQGLRSVGQGFADIVRTFKAYEEQRDAEKLIEQREQKFKYKPPGEEPTAIPGKYRSPKEEQIEYLEKTKAANLKTYEAFIKKFPEVVPGASGIVEKAVIGIARFLPAMGVMAIDPVAGAGMTYAQIFGMSYDEYRKEDIDPEKSFIGASVNAMAQTPIEFAGNLIQIGILKNLAKTFLKGTAKQTAGTLIESVIKGVLAEGGEEYLQQYPDEIVRITLANPDLTSEEIVQEIIMQSPQIHERGKESAKIGGVGGGLLVGLGTIVASPALLADYRSEKQMAIDAEIVTPEETTITEGIATEFGKRIENLSYGESMQILEQALPDLKPGMQLAIDRKFGKPEVAPEEVKPEEAKKPAITPAEQIGKQVADVFAPVFERLDKIEKKITPETPPEAAGEEIEPKPIPEVEPKVEKKEPLPKSTIPAKKEAVTEKKGKGDITTVKTPKPEGGNPITIYAGTGGKGSKEIFPYGAKGSEIFGGIFGSESKSSALSHGDTIQKIYSPNHIDHDGFNHIIFYDESSSWDDIQKDIREIVDVKSKRSQYGSIDELTDEEVDELADYIMGNKNIEEYYVASSPDSPMGEPINDPDMGFERFAEILGHKANSDYLGEMGWKLQAMKGELARRRGYTSVGMRDEHGESVLALQGSQVESITAKDGTVTKFDLPKPPKPEGGNPFKDSVIKEPVYHGTGKELDYLHPWSHFGDTKKAAIERLKIKEETGTGKIVEVYVDLKNPLKTPDLAIFSPIDVAAYYAKIAPKNKKILESVINVWHESLSKNEKGVLYRAAGYIEKPTKTEFINDALKSIKQFKKNEDPGKEITNWFYGGDARDGKLLGDPSTALKIITKKLEQDGYDGIQYINQVEDPGSKAYIVFKSNQIKILPKPSRPPGEVGEAIPAPKVEEKPTGVKEPWEIPVDEYLQSQYDDQIKYKELAKSEDSPHVINHPFKRLRARHQIAVEEALLDNKPVPPEVLKDYPDLVEKPSKRSEKVKPVEEPKAEEPEIKREHLGDVKLPKKETWKPFFEARKFRKSKKFPEGGYEVTIQTATGIKKVKVGENRIRWEKKPEVVKAEPEKAKPIQSLAAKATKTLNEKGTSEAMNDLVALSTEIVRQGHTKYTAFKAELKRHLSEVWDKIKHLVRKLFDQAKAIIANERGGIEIERPEVVQEQVEGTPTEEEIEKELTENSIAAYETVANFWKNRKRGWVPKKIDTKAWERLLSVPTHYFRRVKGLFGVLNAALDRTTEYNNIINDLQQTTAGENLLKRGDIFKHKRKSEYKNIKKYLVHNDRYQVGYHVEYKDNKYVLYDPKGKEVERFSDDSIAWDDSIAREHKDLMDKGFSQQAADTVAGFRRITHNSFDLLVKDLRKIEKAYKESGQPLPVVEVYIDGEVVKVDLRKAVAIMGDRRGYYMPRIRKSGRFALYATKKGEHPILRFYDSKILLNAKQTQLEEQGYEVEKDISRQMPEDVFELAGSIIKTQAVINEALNKAHSAIQKGGDFSKQFTEITQRVEEEFAKAVAEQIANIHKGRGFRAHMERRSDAKGKDVWVGYEEDPVLALGKYVKSLAAGEAKKNMALKMLKAFTGTEENYSDYKTRLAKEGQEATKEGYLEQVRDQRVDPIDQKNAFKDGKVFMEDMLRNDEFADRVIGMVKGISVLKYLGGRVAAPVVNLTAMGTSAPATISYESGVGIIAAFKYIAKASEGYRKYKWGNRAKLDKWTQELYRGIEDNGWHKAQYNKEALSVIKSTLGRGWDTTIDTLMIGFGVTEMYNRIATIGGAYQAIRSKHKGEWTQADHNKAMEQAKYASDQAHAVYGKVSRPHMARGGNVAAQAMQAFYVFKTFSHNYLLTMKDMGFSKQSLFMAISPVVFAGLGASVIVPPLAKLLSFFGLGDDPEEELYNYVAETMGEDAENWLRFGLFGLGGKGVSLKGSLSIGIMDLPTSIKELLGAPGSMAYDIYEGGKSILRGDATRGAEKLLPLNAAGSMIRSVREYREGATTRTGAPLFYGPQQLKPDLIDSILRFGAFNPASMAGPREKLWKESRVERKYRNMKNDIYSKVKRYYLLPPHKRTKAKWVDILTEIKEFNARIRERKLYRIVSPITPSSIKANLKRAFRPKKKERLRK